MDAGKILEVAESDVEKLVSQVERLSEWLKGKEASIPGIAEVAAEIESQAWRLLLTPLTECIPKWEFIAERTGTQASRPVRIGFEGFAIWVSSEIQQLLNDSFVHIVRNAVEHGWGGSASRTGLELVFRARLSCGSLIVDAVDDGAGPDFQKIFQKARSLGWCDPQTTLSPEAALEMIFRPGFTTRPDVDLMSGRGVGLEAVQSFFRNSGGEVSAFPPPSGKGFGLRLQVPLPRLGLMSRLLDLGGTRVWVPADAMGESLGAFNFSTSEVDSARALRKKLTTAPMPANPVWVKMGARAVAADSLGPPELKFFKPMSVQQSKLALGCLKTDKGLAQSAPGQSAPIPLMDPGLWARL